MISAIQTLFYILVGNAVLEIKGMFFSHWLILFSTSCFANLLGLNISSSFNSVKVIYILIPICIIPQLLFSGIIVPFDKLHPYFSSKSEVPIIGNVMASRWAYEAMAVTQFKDNEFEKLIYEDKKNMSFANWKKDQWESTLETKISSFYRNHSLANLDELTAKKVKRDGEIVVNEISKELTYFPESSNMDKNKVEAFLSKIEENNLNKEEYASLISYLSSTRNYYKALYKEAENHHESTIRELLEINNATRENLREQKSEKKISSKDYRKYKRFITKLKNFEFQSFKTKYNNQSLEDVVTNSNTLKFIDEDENSLIQKSDPIFLDPYTFRFL
ncbi:MAG: ABC transporter permease, partial [Bacteroidota bacterium]|nr:ABC transporter permease [Bacteroidota bacterium]